MTKVFAHRGFSGCYPENTMLAFEKAVEEGADGIEFDVQLSLDGELIIMHDETVDRTTDGKGYVKDKTLAELKTLDASASFPGKYGVNRVPTLREYFEFVKDKNIISNIELKTSIVTYSGIEQKCIDLIREFGLEDKIIFSSFNHESVLNCKRIAPQIKCGFLTGDWLVNFGEYTKKYGVECCHPSLFFINENHIKEMHSNGCEVNIWTVDEPDDIRRFASIGVDVIMSNFPDRGVKLLK